MKAKQPRKFPVPPVFKLLLRGYLIMGFILLMEYLGFITDLGIVIFLMSMVSISMVFGVGYLLVMRSRPVRASTFDIPNTVLFFVKGALVLYFVTLLAQFNILPDRITGFLMLVVSAVLVLGAALSYLYEVLERSSPIPIQKPATRPRTR